MVILRVHRGAGEIMEVQEGRMHPLSFLYNEAKEKKRDNNVNKEK